MPVRPTMRHLAPLLVFAVILAGCGGTGSTTDPPVACAEPGTYPTPATPRRIAADAGEDFDIKEGTLVHLNGTASLDLDGSPLTYYWAQVEGTCVTLDLSNPVQPTFKAPNIAADEVLVFQLVVSSPQNGYSAPDQADVMVRAK